MGSLDCCVTLEMSSVIQQTDTKDNILGVTLAALGNSRATGNRSAKLASWTTHLSRGCCCCMRLSNYLGDMLAGSTPCTCFTLVHFGSKAQGAQRLLGRVWGTVDVDKHQSFAVASQAWLHITLDCQPVVQTKYTCTSPMIKLRTKLNCVLKLHNVHRCMQQEPQQEKKLCLSCTAA